MPTKQSSRILLLTLILVAFATLAVNANWGNLGFSRSTTDRTSSAQVTSATEIDSAPAKVMTTPLNAITSFDAALVYRHYLHYSPLLTADQLTVADVNGIGGVTSYDTFLISSYVINTAGVGGSTGTILPSGLLMGDVSGAGAHFDGQPGTLAVSLPNITNTGGTVVVPVTVTDLTGLGVISYDLQVTFDPTVLQPVPEGPDRTGTLGGFYGGVTFNASNPGHLIVSGWGAAPLTGSGTVINLVFNVVGVPGQSTALNFENYTDPGGRVHQSFLFNEGTPSVTTTNGSFTAAAFTATPTFTATSTPTLTSTATSTPTSTVTATGTPVMPTLGTYPNTSVTLSSNATIVPDSAPTNATSITAETTTGFVGELTADPATGVVRVTNAHHANVASGNYTVTVRAFGVNGVMTSRTFALTVTTGTTCTQDVLFDEPAVPWNYVNGLPDPIEVGDFNNDGVQDVVTGNRTAYSSDHASIRLGDGSGGFLSLARPNVQLGGSRPSTLVIGDFNGDGNQDFATANFDSNNVSIRLGDGSGGFTLPVVPEIALGTYLSDISVGDFNGDGKDDLAVVSNGNSNVSIRLGNGDGGFSLPSVPELAFPGPPMSVAIGDFNNDGRQDLAVPNLTSPASSVSIRLGDGNGGFNLSSPPEIPVGRWAGKLAIGDFNGDGNQDFAVTNTDDTPSVPSIVSIRLGNGHGGFVLPAAGDIAVDRNPDKIKIGDLNNDGIQDLAFTYYNRNKVSLRLGDGSGGFAPPTVPYVIFGDSSVHIHDIAIGDFNGDGTQDLATANSPGGSIAIRLGRCGAAPTPTSTASATATNTSTSTNTPTFTPTVDPSAVAVSLQEITTAPENSIVTVPISVGDVTGRGVIAYDLHVYFDPTVITPASPPFDKAGTMSSGMFINFTNTSEPGHLVISAYTGVDMVGFGTLLNLRFNIVGVGGHGTYLDFQDYTDPGAEPGNNFHPKFRFNDGDPPAATTNGVVLVGATISGNVRYGNAIGNPPAPRFVSNVTLNASGSPPVSAVTNLNGMYSLGGLGLGSYTITLSKNGGVNGAITSFDAAKITQYVAGTGTLDPTQLLVSDVSGNSGISSLDAAMLAKFVAGPPYTSPGIGSTATWNFLPTARTYQLVGNIMSEDYDALLMGDVTGNWTDPASSRPAIRRNGPERSSAVSAPSLLSQADKEILIPIKVQGAANRGIIAYEFDLRYDASVVQPQSDPVKLENTASRGLSVVVNPNEPGLLKVVVYGPIPIEEDGLLLNLQFIPVGPSGSVSPLTWERFMFNEGELGVRLVNGQIKLL